MPESFQVYRRTSAAWNMERYHFHDQYEILLSLSEHAKMFVKDRNYELQYGSVILLPPSLLHRSVSGYGREYDRYVIRFSGQYAQELSTRTTNLLRVFMQGRVHIPLSREQTQKLLICYEACGKEYTGFGADLRRNAAFTELILTVNEAVDHSSGAQEESSTAGQGVSEILRYISEHLTEDLSLAHLAERFYISKPHLCRIFKQQTGFAPGEYIIKMRIMRAKSLLADGSSVQEAGEKAGFGSYAHFIRTFHQTVGISPGKYKQSMKG